VDSDWDDGIEDEDLAWVSNKKKTRRIVLGLLLLTLATLTGKLIMDRIARSPATTSTAIAASQDDPQTVVQVDRPPNESRKSEERPAPEAEAVKPEAAKPEAAKPEKVKTATKRPSVKKPAPQPAAQDPGAQARRAKAAKEAAAKRGPQPKTAADFVDRGRQAIQQGDYNAARIHYLEAVFMEPSNAAANQGLAFAALEQGDQSFAVIHFCKALRLSPPTSSLAKETHKTLANLNEKCP
jgi:outer membrane biosynthesis protein TonB